MTGKTIQFDEEFASVADYARYYRYAMGMQIVPSYNPSENKNWKRPVGDWRSYTDQLTDDKTFQDWYGDQGTHLHRTNLGLITGPASHNLFIIDLDTHSHPEALEWWNDIIETYNGGNQVQTPIQRTGGGGLQILMKAPDNWIPPTRKTAIGVDIRGVGGFAVLAPSLHSSGKQYEWLPGHKPWEVPVMEAPYTICELIDHLVGSTGGSSVNGSSVKTATPDAVQNAFGQLIDGREDYMSRLIWGRLVDLRREAPFIGVEELERQMMDAFAVYEFNVKSRLQEKGVSNADLLEREGRGISAFRQKWQHNVNLWHSKVKEAAEQPVPSKKEPEQDFIEAVKEKLNNSDPEQAVEDIFELLSIKQIKKMADPEYLIEGLILDQSLTFGFGPPGCGKSFIFLGMALAIASAQPSWWGRSVRRTGPVIYISSEGVADIKYRIMAWEQGVGCSADATPFYLIPQSMNFMNEGDVVKLIRTVDSVVKLMHTAPAAIVIDTVSRVLPGVDENLQKDITLFIKTTDLLREMYKTAVIGVHHSSRAGNLRGSTVFDGAGDCLLAVSREEGAEIGELRAVKIKSAPDGWRESFKLRLIETGDLKGTKSLYAEKCEQQPEESNWPGKPICQEILNMMQRAWDAKKPWSNHPNTRRDGRYAPLLMGQWNIPVKQAELMLQTWLTNGVIEIDICDTTKKTKGIHPLKTLYEGLGSDDYLDRFGD